MYNYKYNYYELNPKIIDTFPIMLRSAGTERNQCRVDSPDGILYHEFIWVKKNAGVFCINGKTSVLAEGQGVFMRKNTPHSYYGDKFSTSWCVFSMPEEMLDFFGVPDVMYFDVPPFLNEETEELRKSAMIPSTPLQRISFLCSYLNRVFNCILNKSRDITETIYDYLERRYNEPMYLDKIAKDIGEEQWKMCREFTKATGTTIMKELKRIRIENAKKMLVQNSLTVKEIGIRCGFERPDYFIKSFKDLCGVTPNNYRLNKTIKQ